MSVNETTYNEIALQDPSRWWELHDGVLREKPPMTDTHQAIIMRLVRQLTKQIDFDVYDLRPNLTRLRRDERHYYIPDLTVIRVPSSLPLSKRSGRLEVFGEPMPLVVEIWSPSTGGYDVEEKLPEYQRRGDLEIWRIHPFEYTLTVWRRQADGSYSQHLQRTGTIEPAPLPGVSIDLRELFR